MVDILGELCDNFDKRIVIEIITSSNLVRKGTMPTKRQQKMKSLQLTDDTTLQHGEVAGYVRVSTKEQAESGLGIGDQIQKLKAQASLKEWPDPVIFMDDGISGTIHPQERPQMSILIKGIQEGKIKAVIVTALDRLGRTIEGVFYCTKLFQSSNVTFISTKETLDTSTAAGRLCMHMFMVLAEFERDTISERTIAALAEKNRIDGDPGGRLPYGYKRVMADIDTVKGMRRKTVDIEIDDETANVVRLIFTLRSQPNDKRRKINPKPTTLEKIAAEVKRVMPNGPYGGTWQPARILEILRNEDAYRGGPRGDSDLKWPIILDEGKQA